MLQKSPPGIQNKPRCPLVRPQKDLIFRLNLVVEFSILRSTVPPMPTILTSGLVWSLWMSVMIPREPLCPKNGICVCCKMVLLKIICLYSSLPNNRAGWNKRAGWQNSKN